ETRAATEDKIRIPSNGTAFQISSIEGNIARNKNGEPEQVLILNTTADISSNDLAKAVQIRLLPKHEVEKTEETESESSDEETSDQSTEEQEGESETTDESGNPSKWQSPTDVPDDVFD